MNTEKYQKLSQYTEETPQRRTYWPHENGTFLLYLNEKEVEITQQNMETTEDAQDLEPIKGYSYTGNNPDGGTLIQAAGATYDDFASGLIRLVYSENEEMALHSNIVKALRDPEHERAAEWNERWENFEAYCEECKDKAKEVLAR